MIRQFERRGWGCYGSASLSPSSTRSLANSTGKSRWGATTPASPPVSIAILAPDSALSLDQLCCAKPTAAARTPAETAEPVLMPGFMLGWGVSANRTRLVFA
jgi:hypothetical protein